MTEKILLELLREYTDKTGNTATFSHDVWVRPEGITKEYTIYLFKGSCIKRSIRDVTLDGAIHWVKDLVSPGVRA